MTEDIEGFLQFRSPDFMVGTSKTVMVKLTNALNCLCEKPIHNIIITWNSDDEIGHLHRENFLRSVDELMHQRVRIHKVCRAALFGNTSHETRLWCYNANQSYVDLVSRASFTSEHVCPKWPDNLLPVINIRIVRFCRSHCLVDCYDTTNRNGISKRAIFSPAISIPSSVTEIQVYGVWSFRDHFLRLGILSSWKDGNGALPGLHFGARCDASSIAESFLQLSLMDDLLHLTDESLDDDSLEKAHSITKSILVDSYPESESLPASSIHLADEFIRVHEFAPFPRFEFKVLTTRHLSGYHTFFRPTGDFIKLHGAKIQFFQPVDHLDLILIGYLEMEPETGTLIIKSLFPTSAEFSGTPLVFTNLTQSTLSRNLFGEIIVVKRPRLMIVEGLDCLTENVVHAFGRCLSILPKICVLCDSTPERLLIQGSSVLEKGQEDGVSGPILLRYISSLSASSAEFSIRYEKGFEDYGVSSSLQAAYLRSPSNLWAFSCGLFTVGRRIHLKCRLLPEEDQSFTVIPMSMIEPQGAPVSHSCHHLVGLYNYRILSVQDVISLLRNEVLRDNREHKGVWVSLQGYFFKCDASSRRMNAAHNRQRISLWLIDAYRNDPTASFPLRIDLCVNDSSDRAIEQLLHLPHLVHLCIFKARLQDSRLFLPLSPNRLQVSPNSLASYLAASDIPDRCSCFPDNSTESTCRACVAQGTARSRESALSHMNLLSDGEYPKTCLVHIIRCLYFKVLQLEEEDCVRVMLKLIVSDGSATVIGLFDSEELKVSCSSPSFRWLATLLGLEEPITRQLVSYMSRINEESEDPVNIGLNAWLMSPGFLRPMWLTFKKESNTVDNSRWRLNTVNIGKEVRLVIPPLQSLRVTY